MRLIEKKCPNCGANLEFNETDKSCKCTYCKREFEIERDMNDMEKFNLVYDKMKKPFKIIFLVPIIFFVLVFATIIITGITQARRFNSTVDPIIDDVEEKINEGDKLITDVSDLTNDNLDTIGHKCYSTVHQSVVGRNDTKYSYQITGEPRLEKIYVAYKEDSNKVISIYKVIYHNFFNQSDQQIVYVPVVFENVKKSVSFSLANEKNPAPEYYLNDERSSYIYAYGSFDEAYNAVVKPLEEEYTISEQ